MEYEGIRQGQLIQFQDDLLGAKSHRILRGLPKSERPQRFTAIEPLAARTGRASEDQLQTQLNRTTAS